MKNSPLRWSAVCLLVAAGLGLGMVAVATPQDPTVIYLVRHAETEFPPYADSPPNPYLNEVGLARANTLADDLDDASLSRVFSTEYRRTWTTALPVAHRAGLDVEAYDPRDLAGFASELRSLRGTILVVGHSNTTPMLVEALGGDPGEPIDERTEFNRIYKVTIRGGSIETVETHYGVPLPDRLRAEGATTRDAAFIGAAKNFRFYSSFWTNLNDALYWQALPNSTAPPITECLETLNAEASGGWSAAAAWYGDEMGQRNPRTDPLMREVRRYLAALSEEPLGDAATVVLGHLRGAAPAYQLCLWQAHDARNRAWSDDLLDLVDKHEDEMISRLETAYKDSYPELIPVDIMSYANWAGANTMGRPLHMALSSVDPDNLGAGSFEILYHEGSHGVFGPGWGHTYEVLATAFESRGLEARRDIWHAVLFFTTGQISMEILHANGYPDYSAYMVRGGVYDEYYPLLLEAWQPYLDGEIDLSAAAEAFAASVEAARDAG